MVKIAIAGGTGNVAQEIVDVLVATGKHEILILSRRDKPSSDINPGITWIKTTYDNVNELAEIFKDVHTVLSFISPHRDQQDAITVQKNLIDASVQAGVKRLAPSEWASKGLDHMDWYAYKTATRQYLLDLNKDNSVLEYSLFLPGLFTNYMTFPHQSTKHIKPLETPFDFANCRALTLEGGDNDPITLTTVQDLAHIVARAIEHEGTWPVVGGINGTTMTIGSLIALGEKVRGAPFKVDRLKAHELEAGTWKSSWLPSIDHPSILPKDLEKDMRDIAASLTLAFGDGAFRVGDEWNRLLPEYEFTSADKFLEEAWRGKE
ncbi:hypothetical protein GQ44DRAFT_614793 [Phaeosphaeriaceae sp. PMI808]|nr:hypothetical protein GQ44DRAFT_614793 [Phaeosphaeriaceae sp. PMI808]